MKKQIFSIQSQVAHGYVGNSIARLAIQLHGLEPLTIPTVIFSNHVGYEHTYGCPIDEPLFRDLLKGVIGNHFIDQCGYMITGYCNRSEIITAIAQFLTETKPSMGYTYVYDPVCGDHNSNGLYIPKAIADYSIAQLLPLCDIVTPNHFEVEYILNRTVSDSQELCRAITEHNILNDKTVVVTGIIFNDTPENHIEVALIRNGQLTRFSSPMLPVELDGSGDLFTAILTSQLTLGRSIEQAIEYAMSYLHRVLVDTHASGCHEIATAILIKNMGSLI